MNRNHTAKKMKESQTMTGIALRKRFLFFSIVAVLVAAIFGIGLLLTHSPADGNDMRATVKKKGLELSIAPRKQVFAQGDKLAFVVTVKNVSKKSFRLIEIARMVENNFSNQAADFQVGRRNGNVFKENIGLHIRLSSARGNGAPPPGEDVPSMELKPGKSTTFDLDLRSSSTVFAELKTKPLRTVKQLPPGEYQTVFTFHFRHPMILKDGKFVERPDASFWTGDVTAAAVKFEIAKLKLAVPGDAAAMAELFFETVHAVNSRDYTPEQPSPSMPKRQSSG